MGVIQGNSRKLDTDSFVPKTKMVDIGKLISFGNLLSGKSRDLCSYYVRTFDFVLRKVNSVLGADHMIRFNYIYSRLPITRSLTFLTHRDSSHSLLHSEFQLATRSSRNIQWARV